MRRLLPAFLLGLLVLFLSASLPARADGTTGDDAAAGEEIAGVLTRTPRAAEEETPYLTQCELGCAVTDAVRYSLGTDIALVSTADLSPGARLPAGAVTEADILSVLAQDEPLARAAVTPAALYALLEAAVSHIQLDTVTERIVPGTEVYAGFCQVSGLTFRYDVSAPVFSRVLEITLGDGTALDRADGTTVLTLGAPENILNGALGLPAADYSLTDETLAGALAGYIGTRTSLPEGRTARIAVVGSRDTPLVGMLPRGALLGGLAVLAVTLVFWRTRYNRLKDEYGFFR